jgi:hypothetical protein
MFAPQRQGQPGAGVSKDYEKNKRYIAEHVGTNKSKKR